MKKIVFLVIGILLLVSVPATVYFVGQQQDIRSRAAPATTLSFNPTTVTKPIDEQFTVNVDINTGTNNVTAAKIVVTFDSTKLEATSITNGAMAPKITASGVVAAGTASITVAAESTARPINGTGTIAIIRLKGKAGTTTPAQLKFDTTTFASGLTESTNVITTMGTATINITGSGGNTATTTLTPTQTPTKALTSVTPTTKAVIPTEEPTPTEEATDSADMAIGGVGGSDEVPVTGSTENTIALLIIGVSCIFFSSILYSKAHQSV